jgi:hypothetical protein
MRNFDGKVRLVAMLSIALALPAIAGAQQVRPSRLAVDTATALDDTVDRDGTRTTGATADAIVSLGLGRRFEAVAWPIVQRVAATGATSADLWIATLRYQRSDGRTTMRIDGGLLASPVGLANFTVRRPHLNPTIGQPASLFLTLPSPEGRGPRPGLMGAIYPLGGQVSLSGRRWDARAAIIDSSPLRRRGVFANPKPPRFANVVIGGGVTPLVGLHIGSSVTRGGWLRAGESPTSPADRDATVVSVESEYELGYTKLAAEWVRSSMDTSSGTRVGSGWFAQVQHILAPRWFVAGRVERIEAPLVLPTGVQMQRLTGVEEVVGFRLTPEVTVRGGHRARQTFGQATTVHQFSMSLVWWRRWI